MCLNVVTYFNAFYNLLIFNINQNSTINSYFSFGFYEYNFSIYFMVDLVNVFYSQIGSLQYTIIKPQIN